MDLYQDLRNNLEQVSRVTGLGDFACTKELAEMLGLKAMGGEGDLDSALAAHLEVLALMRDTIAKSVTDLSDQDTATGQVFDGFEIN